MLAHPFIDGTFAKTDFVIDLAISEAGSLRVVMKM
jgi:hypothetical protein